MKINYDFYKDPELVPILDVAESLGLECTGGKYLCPCHNDHNPSMDITSSGIHANRFKCWSCGESGNPLNLVMAVQFGVSPSAYYQNPPKYRKERNAAAVFIDKLFPGAIIKKDHNKENGPDAFPDISPKVLKEIGLKPNFLLTVAGHTDFFTSKNDVAKMLLNCIHESIKGLEKQLDKLVYTDFPDISDTGRRYITHIIAEKQECLEQYKEKLLAYLEAHKEIYQIPDFSDAGSSRKDKFYQKNINAFNRLYERGFPRLSPKVVKLMGAAIDMEKLETGKQMYEIAMQVSEGLSICIKDGYAYKEKLMRTFPDLPIADKRYISKKIDKNLSVLYQYQDTMDTFAKEAGMHLVLQENDLEMEGL